VIASVQEAALALAFTAARARLDLVAVFILAGLAWWSSADRMRGMDEGPRTDSARSAGSSASGS
jgi:hypothetical protein